MPDNDLEAPRTTEARMNLKEIHYGIEIETVKRTREQIAWAIHSVVGGTVRHVGIPSSYDPWEVEDLRGRVWKVVGDAP